MSIKLEVKVFIFYRVFLIKFEPLNMMMKEISN